MNSLNISRKECRICNLLQAHPHALNTVVAELHRLYDDCAADELSNNQNIESIERVIRHHHRVGICNCSKEGEGLLEIEIFWIEKEDISKKQKDKGKK